MYKTGLEVYTNFSDEAWKVSANNKTYVLPKYGVLAYMPGSNLLSFSGENTASAIDKKVDIMISDDLCYLDTYGGVVTKGKIRGKGSYMLKKERTGWEIIPLGNVELIDFDTDLLQLFKRKLEIRAFDEQGNFIKSVVSDKGKTTFKPKKNAYKYKIVPLEKN